MRTIKEFSNTKPRTRSEQPLHVAQISDALLNLQTVRALSGLGKTSIYALIKSGVLRPIRMGARCTRFRASEVQAWLRAQGAEVAK